MNKALVALYARVSSGQQVKNGTIGSQLATIRDRIREDGHLLPDAMLFIDDGVSGATLVRPQLERLRDCAAVGDIERLYVLSPDRLARKYAYQALLMEEFSACGVEVIFINHTSGDTPEEMMLLQIQGMFAEYERGKIMERNRRGKLHGARCGNVGVLSGAPYGYRYIRRQSDGTPAQYIVNLHEASVVREIFSWAGIEHLSLGGVVRRLAEKGIESATGNPVWDRSTIWGMLKNPAYKGLAVFGKTKNCAPRPRVRAARNSADILKNGYSVIRNKPDDGIVIPVPAIINSALFLTVNEQLEENRRHARQGRRGAAYLLQGLTVCGHCRYAYYGKKVSKSAAKGGAQYTYYHCTGTDAYRFGGIRVCDNKQVRTSMLDETVWTQVVALLSEPERLKKEYEQRLTQVSEHSGQTADAERLKKQENQLNVGRSRLIDSFAEGLIDKTDFEPRIRVMTLRLAELERQRAKVEQATESQRDLLLLVNRVEDFAAAVTERLSTDDFLMKREILRALVKRIEIYRDEIVVVFRVNPGNDTSLETGSDKTSGRSLPDCLRSKDTATGKYLLIPQGTRLIGAYTNDVAYGQSAVMIAWQRLIFPDGKALDIDAMPGADNAGYSGFRDQVNNHYFRIFSSALLMSVVTAGISYSQDRNEKGNDGNNRSMNSQMSQALGQQFGQVITKMIEKNLDIAPTLEIRPGYRFNIMIIKDINFTKAYQSFDY